MFRLIHDFTRFRLLHRRFAADRRGVILPLVAILIVPLIGLAALALETPRYFDLPTIEVSLRSAPAYPLTFDFPLLSGILRVSNINFPTTKTSLTGEDLSSSG